MGSKGCRPFCPSCCEGRHLKQCCEMAGKLLACATCSNACNFLAAAYSGRAIRDAARSTSQGRSPPGAGMEETDASVSCGISVFDFGLGWFGVGLVRSGWHRLERSRMWRLKRMQMGWVALDWSVRCGFLQGAAVLVGSASCALWVERGSAGRGGAQCVGAAQQEQGRIAGRGETG